MNDTQRIQDTFVDAPKITLADAVDITQREVRFNKAAALRRVRRIRDVLNDYAQTLGGGKA